MKKDEYIKRYGEAAWDKKLAQTREWKKAHREQIKQKEKQWRDSHPTEVLKRQHDGNRKGGKYYEKTIAAQRIGVQRDKNRLRSKHRRQYHPYKMIIAPDSQIHHEWCPLSSEYRGVALVEATPHQYGTINVILILDGNITLLSENDVRNGYPSIPDNV